MGTRDMKQWNKNRRVSRKAPVSSPHQASHWNYKVIQKTGILLLFERKQHCCCYYNYMVCFGFQLGCKKCGGKKVEEAFLILSFKRHFFRQPVSVLTSQRGQLPAACILSIFSIIDWLEVYDFNPHFAHSVTSRKEEAACCRGISK